MGRKFAVDGLPSVSAQTHRPRTLTRSEKIGSHLALRILSVALLAAFAAAAAVAPVPSVPLSKDDQDRLLTTVMAFQRGEDEGFMFQGSAEGTYHALRTIELLRYTSVPHQQPLCAALAKEVSPIQMEKSFFAIQSMKMLDCLETSAWSSLYDFLSRANISKLRLPEVLSTVSLLQTLGRRSLTPPEANKFIDRVFALYDADSGLFAAAGDDDSAASYSDEKAKLADTAYALRSLLLLSSIPNSQQLPDASKASLQRILKAVSLIMGHAEVEGKDDRLMIHSPYVTSGILAGLLGIHHSFPVPMPALNMSELIKFANGYLLDHRFPTELVDIHGLMEGLTLLANNSIAVVPVPAPPQLHKGGKVRMSVTSVLGMPLDDMRLKVRITRARLQTDARVILVEATDFARVSPTEFEANIPMEKADVGQYEFAMTTISSLFSKIQFTRTVTLAAYVSVLNLRVAVANSSVDSMQALRSVERYETTIALHIFYCCGVMCVIGRVRMSDIQRC